MQRFLHIEAASGVVLLLCAAVALALANSPAAGWFAKLWKTEVSFAFGGLAVAGDVGHLVINDGLMALFFFVVGLEIKRELVLGELRGWRHALLPVAAAAGGMVAPAAIYLAFQGGQPGQSGWAIPMATDIAFVVGILALFGNRVPLGLKILLLSLAIVDDLGAVLVIAIVFTGSIAWGWLGAAAGGLALIYALNRAGLRQVGAYLVIGVFVWFAVYKSGVHPTVAGVLLGLLTPTSAWIGDRALSGVIGSVWQRLFGPSAPRVDEDERTAELERLEFAAREGVSPLHRLESALHPWVAFGIMPVFALANAGVMVGFAGLGDPVAIAVALGLVMGKPMGILLFSWVAVRCGVTKLPDGVTWGMMGGAACLAGIGFTMSLFLTGLSFPPTGDESGPDLAAAGKVGTLLGSLVAGVVGGLWLHAATRAAKPEPQTRRASD